MDKYVVLKVLAASNDFLVAGHFSSIGDAAAFARLSHMSDRGYDYVVATINDIDDQD